MDKKNIAYIIANFGGPRSIPEVAPFLKALLTDQDVVRTKFPGWLHYLMFSRIAKRRAKKVSRDYESIGGKSPIYADTEAVAECLRKHIDFPILTFHRYLPATHEAFIQSVQRLQCDEVRVFPMFPQFTYATTGSIARWFQNHFSPEVTNKMRWVKSYPSHPAFILAHQNNIRNFLKKNDLTEKECILLFSAHGIPKKFVLTGDLYEDECKASFKAVMEAFPEAMGRLAYQSKFGPGEWLKPYTIDVCEDIKAWCKERHHVVFVPISFTSDHIETLFEIEEEYMPVIREKGLFAHRVPALTLNPDWVQSIATILHESNFCNNQMLVRKI